MISNGRIGVRPRPPSPSDDNNKNSASESTDHQQSVCSFEGTKGVVGCDVVVDGTLGLFLEKNTKNCCNNNNNPTYDRFVRCYSYSSFQNLQEFMVSSKANIETSDNMETLGQLHSKFLHVVEQILDQGLYSDELEQRYNIKKPFFIRKYASPSVRIPNDDDDDDNDNTATSSTSKPNTIMFANYLHNDAWFKSNNQPDNNPIAMINVWFILNDDPPHNQLVFYETCSKRTSQTHMLHGRIDDIEGKTVVYNKDMCWGKFYCFVSGQQNDSDRVLLHGAMDVVTTTTTLIDDDDKNKRNVRNYGCTPRRSCEMRYTLHSKSTSTTPKMKDKSGNQTDDEDDNHFGRALFETNNEEEEEDMR